VTIDGGTILTALLILGYSGLAVLSGRAVLRAELARRRAVARRRAP
jgi:hypothetical protein